MLLIAPACDAPPDELDIIEDELILRDKPLLCVDAECVDGVKDTSLRFRLSNVDFRDQSFKVGKRVELLGYESRCLDSPCSRSLAIVRSASSGKLLAASFGGVPSQYWAPSLAPVSVSASGEGLCDPFDAGCEDDTFWQRGSIDVSSSEYEGFARVLDRTAGWAPGGYHVNVGRFVVGNGSCDGYSDGLISIIRDACDADIDCPVPDVANTCEAAAGPYNSFQASLDDFIEPYGAYAAQCEIVSTVANHDASRVTVGLDCVYTQEPMQDD